MPAILWRISWAAGKGIHNSDFTKSKAWKKCRARCSLHNSEILLLWWHQLSYPTKEGYMSDKSRGTKQHTQNSINLSEVYVEFMYHILVSRFGSWNIQEQMEFLISACMCVCFWECTVHQNLQVKTEECKLAIVIETILNPSDEFTDM
jgi:hypothetical protein